MLTPEEIRAVAPALEKYCQDALLGDLWKRPGLRRGIAASLRSRP